MTSLKAGSLQAVLCITHHFVFVTLEADDAAPVADSIRTGLAAGVLQLQDTSVPCRTRLHLPQTHIFISSNLHTGRWTGGTLPWTCHKVSRVSVLDCRFIFKDVNLNTNKQTKIGWCNINVCFIILRTRVQACRLTSRLHQRPADVNIILFLCVLCRRFHLPVSRVQSQRGEVVRLALTITEGRTDVQRVRIQCHMCSRSVHTSEQLIILL